MNHDCVFGNGLSNRFDGFTSTFQDKLFKGYNMEIHNQIFYTTLCSCVLSFTGETLTCFLLSLSSFSFLVGRFPARRFYRKKTSKKQITIWSNSCSLLTSSKIFFFFFVGLVLQGHLLLAVDFVSRHRDCLLDIALLSTVSLSFSFLSFSAHSLHSIM